MMTNKPHHIIFLPPPLCASLNIMSFWHPYGWKLVLMTYCCKTMEWGFRVSMAVSSCYMLREILHGSKRHNDSNNNNEQHSSGALDSICPQNVNKAPCCCFLLPIMPALSEGQCGQFPHHNRLTLPWNWAESV